MKIGKQHPLPQKNDQEAKLFFSSQNYYEKNRRFTEKLRQAGDQEDYYVEGVKKQLGSERDRLVDRLEQLSTLLKEV